jgi:rare lipoprotein A
LIGALALSGCSSERSGGQGEQTSRQKESAAAKSGHKEVGEASWYGLGFEGPETANGEPFNHKGMTAAHPTLPMRTKAEVTNLENGRKVAVKINDRGPYAKGRAIDLSRAAAENLDMKKDGTALVKIEVKPKRKKRCSGSEAKPALAR